MNEIAPKMIDRIKAGTKDGEFEYRIYRVVWEGRAEVRQQDKSEKQDTIQIKNGRDPINRY